MAPYQPPLTRRDLAFLLEVNGVPAGRQRSMIRRLAVDPDLRRAMVDNEEMFRVVLQEQERLVEISPPLLFEILLYKVRADLQQMGDASHQAFDLNAPTCPDEEVLDLLDDERVMAYLSGMLASFISLQSHAIELPGKGRAMRQVRYSDLDLHSLLRLSEAVRGRRRLVVYRRVADICLFMLGIFPDFVERNHCYPSGELRPLLGATFGRISPEEYQVRGRQFYRLAAEHRSARGRRLADVLWSLHEGFQWALKPLNILSFNYLHGAGALTVG